MQYCYDNMQLKCLFDLCCDFSEYQSENFNINLSLLIILTLIGSGLCFYLFFSKKDSNLESHLENRNNNNSFNNNYNNTLNFSAFGKNLNLTQINFLKDRRNLSDRYSPFIYISNTMNIFLNIFIAYLFLAKFFEMLNLYNEYNFKSTIIVDNINTDKNILKDDYFIPRKILEFSFQIFGLIVVFTIFNLDSEFLDHNKKNTFTILYFLYYLYDSINIYTEKKILLYENYLFYSIISVVIIILIFVYSIYINKIFFSKLSKIFSSNIFIL